ncbi:MAG: alginate export family protein [Bryobacteraceae bacterium]|nr:alginate export family protein [Bryobacteraceae bacterium]
MPFMRPLEMLREEEDWSFLRDPSMRTDFWDPLKYIQLGKREGWYLTLGAETRQFYEVYRNEVWGMLPPDDTGYLLQRYMFHSDWHLGDRFRVFGQLKSGLVIGREGQPRPMIDEDKLDVNQAWVDINLIPKKGAFRHPLTLRVGRQEMNYGSGRLVSIREGPNVRLSFDGLRLISNFRGWRVDGFAVRPVDTLPGIFEDRRDHTQTFWGVYSTGRASSVPFVNRGNVDLYYLGLRRKFTAYDQGFGSEMRHTVGARMWQRQRERPWDYDVDTAFQFGRWGPGNIRAWTVGAGGGHTFQATKWQPRLGVNAGITSGDKDPNDPNLQTFFAPYPDGHYFGQIAQNGPMNIMGLRPIMTLNLKPGMMINAEFYFFWRTSLRDGIYAIPGFPLRTGRLSDARFIGAQPQIELFWIVNNHVMLSVHHAQFVTGPFLNETPPGRHVKYLCGWISYRF